MFNWWLNVMQVKSRNSNAIIGEDDEEEGQIPSGEFEVGKLVGICYGASKLVGICYGGPNEIGVQCLKFKVIYYIILIYPHTHACGKYPRYI